MKERPTSHITMSLVVGRKKRPTTLNFVEPVCLKREQIHFNAACAEAIEDMETTMCGRVPLSPKHVFNQKPGDTHSLYKRQCINRGILMKISATGPGKGGGLLERPTTEKTSPGRESEFDLRKLKKTAPPYRVLLHNDDHNKGIYVVRVLMKVIPGMNFDNAVNIMQEAHFNGLAVVIICAQANAEEHCMQLRGSGLLSSIEPASGGN